MQNQQLFEAPFNLEVGTNGCYCSKGISAGKCNCSRCQGKALLHSHPSYESQWLFELPDGFSESPDYSEGTGRRKAANRIDPRSIHDGDILRGGVEPIRRPKPRPPRTVVPSLGSLNQPQTIINPQEAARQKANQKGASLTRHFIDWLKSNPSGTAVRARARIRAGAEMIRLAKKLRDTFLVEAYRTVGQQLINHGNADLHPSKSK